MKQTKLIVFLMLLVILASLIPSGAMAAEHTKRTDAHTMDEWEEFFGPEVSDTSHAGVIWGDKSVFLSSDDFAAATGYTAAEDPDERGFLVSLSAMAANKSIVGYSTIPTDTMFILDMSSSMYVKGGNKYHETVEAMANAVNTAIANLQSLNQHNRVGVAIYYGGATLPNASSTSNMYLTLMPLDRYQAGDGGKFITHTGTNASFSGIATAANLKASSGVSVQRSHKVAAVAGTYTQLGINAALSEFLAASTVVPDDAPLQAGSERMPVFVLLSDGEPTAASTNYQTPGTSEMGNNYTGNRNDAQSDFATQLTASLAKAKADAHYQKHTPLFYTLSLGTDISDDVMKGSLASTSFTSTIQGYWNTLIAGNTVSETVQHYTANSHAAQYKGTHTVTFSRLNSVKVDGQEIGPFPKTLDQLDYVDRNFTAQQASSLTDAFEAIVEEIRIQSRYVPTWIDQDGQNLSGYMEFYDTISKYMQVERVRGILLGDTLYTGAHFASTLTTGMGTVDNPTHLGDEFIRSIRKRLNLGLADARQLADDAFNAGQLHYASPSDYSNYIGWFASADRSCLGFWDGEAITDETDVPDGAVFAVKSYGMLGKNDDTQLLYTAIDVCEALGTEGSAYEKGETVVVWDIPASLIPMTTYSVTLDSDAFSDTGLIEGKGATVEVAASSPIRLLYDVRLRDDITSGTVAGIMKDAEDPAAFRVENGRYTFFTNKYDTSDLDARHDHPILHRNASVYFEPSLDNERYYFTEDTKVYVKNGSSYQLYTGSSAPDPDGEYYRQYPVFDWNASGSSAHDAVIRFRYTTISKPSLQEAERSADGTSWYIPKNVIYRALGDYRHTKSDNTTGTLAYAHYLTIDQDVDTQRYYAVFALGNNGSISLDAAADLTIHKTFAGDTAQLTDAYKNALTFTVTGPGGFSQTVTYADFTNGSYTFSNVAPGAYTVAETNAALDDYVIETAYSAQGGRITLANDDDAHLTITNTYDKQEAGLTLRKTFAGDLTAVTDEYKNGISFTVTGPDGFEQVISYADFANGSYTLTGLKLGEYTVAESNAALEHYNVATVYQVNGAEGSSVTLNDADAPVISITNTYAAQPGNLTVSKFFGDGSDLTGSDFANGIPVTVTAVDGSAEFTATLSSTNNWTHSFTGLVPGDYTVTEASPHDPNYYTLSAVFTGVNEGTANEVTVQPGSTRYAQVSITNTYTLGQAHELIIPFEKLVGLGPGGDVPPMGETTFYFTLDLHVAQPMALRSTVQPGEFEVEYRGAIETSDLPAYDFKVTVDGTDVAEGWIVIRGNAYDLQRLTVTITESELGMLERWTYESGPDYAWTVTAPQQADGSFAPVITDAEGQSAPKVHFDNCYTEAAPLPPTGDGSHPMLWAGLTAVSTASFLLLFKRRERRQH